MKNKISIAIAVAVILLVVILVVAIVHPHFNDETPSVTTETAPLWTIPTAATLPVDSTNSIHLGQNLYVVRIGNSSGYFVEDGSDEKLDSVATAMVVNRGERTVQLAEFDLTYDSEVYSFSFTTLPAGASVTVQEVNKKSFEDEDADFSGRMDVFTWFPEEPSLYEDVFAVTGMENGVELRNLTDQDIAGPIYVYYKTRTADGFLGGITYRVTIEQLKAGESYRAATKHFQLGTSEVMFITYAQ